MVVGVCSIDFLVHGNNSLKGKRQAVKAVIQRLRNRFNVSVAEVGDNDLWQRGRLGFCVVGNDRRHVNSMVDKALNFIGDLHLIELINYSVEFISFNTDGL